MFVSVALDCLTVRDPSTWQGESRDAGEETSLSDQGLHMVPLASPCLSEYDHDLLLRQSLGIRPRSGEPDVTQGQQDQDDRARTDGGHQGEAGVEEATDQA